MKQNLWFLMTLIVMPAILQARYHSVGSQKEFESLINKYRYAAVCFAPSNQFEGQDLDSDDKREIKHEFKELQSKMKAASDRDVYHRYLGKDVGFLVVDVASKRAYEISHDYALSKFPSCLVFQSGALARKQPLIDPQSSNDILTMLEQTFGNKLNEMIKERKEDERLMRQERIASYYAYGASPYSWYPYSSWPYSRWGAYPYYGGWSFGFGW